MFDSWFVWRDWRSSASPGFRDMKDASLRLFDVVGEDSLDDSVENIGLNADSSEKCGFREPGVIWAVLRLSVLGAVELKMIFEKCDRRS
jgi:hypothetical protein